MLAASLLDISYAYYLSIRLAVAITCIYLGYKEYENERQGFALAFFAAGLIFQPFWKFPLEGPVWNALVIVLAIAILFHLLFVKTQKNS